MLAALLAASRDNIQQASQTRQRGGTDDQFSHAKEFGKTLPKTG